MPGILDGVPIAGIGLAGLLLSTLFLILGSKDPKERLDWMFAATAGSIVYVMLLFIFGG